MNFYPDSLSFAELLEANDCHDPENGQFTFKGRGRCLGITARKAAAKDGERELNKSGMYYPTRQRSRVVRALRALPAYMRKDAHDAWKAERTIVRYGKDAPAWMAPDPASANSLARMVAMKDKAPGAPFLYGKDEQLTVLRHELGHLDKTPIGRARLFGMRFPAEYVEEIRAWKNAIRNSKGRVDFGLMQQALATYAEDAVRRIRMMGSGMNRAEKGLNIAPIEIVAEIVSRQHTRLLRRYARRVKRAAA
jgi:hypothetical protein